MSFELKIAKSVFKDEELKALRKLLAERKILGYSLHARRVYIKFDQKGKEIKALLESRGIKDVNIVRLPVRRVEVKKEEKGKKT